MHLAEAQHDALFVGIDAVEAGAEPDGNGNQDQQQDAAPRDAAAGHELAETVLAAPQQFLKIWGIGAATEAAATRAGRAVARSEKRRVGKERGSPLRSRWAPRL